MGSAITETERALLTALLSNPGVRAKALRSMQSLAGLDINCLHLLARLHRKGLVAIRDGAWYPTDAGRQAAGWSPEASPGVPA